MSQKQFKYSDKMLHEAYRRNSRSSIIISKSKSKNKNNDNQQPKNVSSQKEYTKPAEPEQKKPWTSKKSMDVLMSLANQKKHPNDNFFHLPSEGKSKEKWFMEMVSSCVSMSLYLFMKQELTFNESKAYCCELIFFNYFRDSGSEFYEIYSGYSYEELSQLITKIFQFISDKYPKVDNINTDKKLQKAVKQLTINNLENDDYDLIQKSGVDFSFKEDGDYSKEIMAFINYTISTLFQNEGGGMNLFQEFSDLMSKIFRTVYKKNNGNDLEETLKYMRGQTKPQKFKSQQEIEYRDKVQSYTEFMIGSKLPESTRPYTQYQMQSGKINAPSAQILRILDKWMEQLQSKIIHYQKFIGNRTYRYKGAKPKERNKLSAQNQQILMKVMKSKANDILKSDQSMRKTLKKIFRMITKLHSEKEEDDYPFIHQIQKDLWKTSIKNMQAATELLVLRLNFIIHLLLKSVREAKKQFTASKPLLVKSQIDYFGLNINLITFKIGDILRCKCSSNEDQILRIFYILKGLSQIKDQKVLNIVRVKNRLNQGLRDVLINAYFKEKLLIEIQLNVNSKSNSKQYFYDKFNHFLYEIYRSKLGCIYQMQSIMINLSPKANAFAKVIQSQEAIKISRRKQNCKLISLQSKETIIQNYPLVCQSCKIFYRNQQTIFPNITIDEKLTICGECYQVIMSEQQKIHWILAKFRNMSQVVEDISNQLTIITNLQQLKDATYLVMFPRKSKKINVYTAIKLTLLGRIYFTICLYRNKKVQVSVLGSFNPFNKDQIHQFFQEFICLKSCLPLNKVPKEKIITDLKDQYETVLISQFLTDLNQEKREINVLGIELNGQTLLLPMFQPRWLSIEQQLMKEMNLCKLSKSIKESKTIIEMSRQLLTSEITQLPLNLRLRMNTFTKQLYIDDNKITNIDFVAQMNELIILSANSNKLESIKKLPPHLQQASLHNNQIICLSFFSKENSSLRYVGMLNNKVASFDDLLPNPYLKKLVLGGNLLNSLEGVSRACKLEFLIVSESKINKIQHLKGLAHLSRLSIGMNLLISKIEGLQECFSLTSLILSKSSLSKIQNLSHLSQLRAINLNQNRIEKLDGLIGLASLTQVRLQDNQISKMEGLDTLLNLQVLALSRNLISRLQGLSKCASLEELELDKNSISKIQGLECNRKLRKLILNNNQIKIISGLTGCRFLQELYLSHNHIKIIQNIEGLTTLGILQLSNNPIEHARLQRPFSDTIRCIFLNNCKFKSPESLQWVLTVPKTIEKITLYNANQLIQQTLSQHPKVFFREKKTYQSSSNNGTSQL